MQAQGQQKDYKKFFVMSATAAIFASAIVPVASAATTFPDVDSSDTHAENIYALVEAGIIKGYQDGNFKPNAPLKRGHVVKMLGKWLELQGKQVPKDYKEVQRFNDVPVDGTDEELLKYAALVKDEGVFVGSNGNLNPLGNITRENMALTLDRAYKAVYGISLVEYAKSFEKKSVADLADAKEEAREQIQAFRDIGLSNVDNFCPKETVTRAQFASFLNRTIQISPNNEEVDTREITIQSLEATGVSQFTIKFNKAVTSADTAKFDVTRGSSIITVEKVKWNEEKTEAVVTVEHKFSDSTYQVKVSEVSEKALTASFTTTQETVTSIQFLSDKLIFTGRSEKKSDKKVYKEAIITYAIYNQYGEDITKRVVETDLDPDIKRIDIFGKEENIEVKNGRFIVWVDKDEDEDAIGTVELTYEKDVEVSVSQDVQLSDESEPAQVEIVGVYHPTNKTLSVENLEDKEEFSILFKLKDQYGVEIDAEYVDKNKNRISTNDTTILEQVREGLRVSVSDDDIFEVEDEEENGTGFGKDGIQVINVDGEYYFAIDIFAENPNNVKGGENTVTFRAKATGEEFSKTFTVEEFDQPYRIELAKPDELVAGGEEVKIPVFAYNQAGDLIKNVNTLNEDLRKGLIKIDWDNGLTRRTGNAISVFHFVEEKGNIFLKFETGDNKKDEAEDYDLQIEVEQSGIETELTLMVYPNAYPITITRYKEDPYLTSGDSTTLELKNFIIEDQYGRTFNNVSSGSESNKDYTFYKLSFESLNEDVFRIETSRGRNGNESYSVRALKNGSGTIEVTLTSFNVKKEKQESKFNLTFRSYDIDDFDSFKVKNDSVIYGGEYVSGNRDDATVKVIGMVGDIEVEFPDNLNLYNISRVGEYLSTDGVDVTADIVAIRNDDVLKYDDDRYESEFEVTINNTGDVFKQKVTIVRENPKANTLNVTRKDKVGKVSLQELNLKLTDDSNGDGVLSYLELFDAINDVASFEVKEQYGNKASITGTTGEVKYTYVNNQIENLKITVSDIDSSLGSGIVSANGTSNIQLRIGNNGLKVGDSFTLTISIDGKTKALKAYIVE